MTRGLLRSLLLSGTTPFVLAALCIGCTRNPGHPRANLTHETPHFLGEWFQVASGHCRVEKAEAYLLPSLHLPFPGARIRPDVPTIEVALRCQRGDKSPISARKALEHQPSLLLETPDGALHAARPELSEDQSDSWLFELSAASKPALPAPRIYDARTGELVSGAHDDVAKLIVQNGALRHAIALRAKFRATRFYDALDALVTELTRRAGASTYFASREAQDFFTSYLSVVARFQPTRIKLLAAEQNADKAQIHLILGLLGPERSAAPSREVARFELALAADTFTVQTWPNAAQLLHNLACADAQAAFERELTDLTLEPTRPDDSCNLLGTLVPFGCRELALDVRTRALSLGLRCGPFAAHEKPEHASLPSDFQVVLRRGKRVRALDRSPLYVVSLFATGQVVFHGQSWVHSDGRRDGRTDPRLLSGLYEHLMQLAWFDRRGGSYDLEHCNPSDHQGDVITVSAGGRSRMILQREHCRGPFRESELTALTQHVERVAAVSAWTAPRPSLLDKHVQHWTIPE